MHHLRFATAAVALAAVSLCGCANQSGSTGTATSPAPQESAALSAGNDWPSYGGTLQSSHYSSLTEITPANVAQLKAVCTAKLDENGAFQATPIVISGTLYVPTAHDTYAIDAKTCAITWRSTYTPKGHEPFPVDRGLAYAGDRLVRGETDGHLVALDVTSGKTLWDVAPASGERGEFLSSAPIVWNGTVYIGTAGSDWGVKGRMMAFDVSNGALKWTFTTIASGKDANAKSWPDATAASRGGGGMWTSYTLDPASGELFVPVANPAPDFLSSARPGANLYTDSVVVLDASTGALKWYVQTDPHDVHDWDMSAPPVLFTTADGKAMLGAAGKDGVLYGIDRSSHAIVYRTPEVRRSGVNDAPTLAGRHICPGVLGGSEWNGPAYDEKDGLLITPMDDWCATVKLAAARYVPGQFYFGGSYTADPYATARGTLTATDRATGKIAWKYTAKAPMLAGVTPTASGVTFTGDMAGNVLAFDSASGKVLATFPTQGSIAGSVVTYAVGGKQYVAATSGNISRLTWGNHGSPTIVVYSL
ncbi:MAG: PQQ-binding-like beta-propeller repeat protein [Candidatus Eremiobacteraeota bacterium]|nr:PQQ-binding-like beta-propeller repeat protein [Candidatus Eremiobacteraeota bacterium]